MSDDENKKVSVDTGLKVALQSVGVKAPSGNVSAEELEELSGKVSQGVRLRMEAQAKEKNRVLLWKSRVNLVKQGRTLMTNKQFAEAAATYEKYLKVLELIYEIRSGELGPETFNKSSRSKELTVITSVYWDLLRIYDTSPRYHERMLKAAGKLALFLPYSKILSQVSKALITFERTSKNSKIIKSLMKQLKIKTGSCFIATAVYESEFHHDLTVLRYFRDHKLKASFWGRKFTYYYYKFSPNIAKSLNSKPFAKLIIRNMLKAFVGILR